MFCVIIIIEYLIEFFFLFFIAIEINFFGGKRYRRSIRSKLSFGI